MYSSQHKNNLAIYSSSVATEKPYQYLRILFFQFKIFLSELKFNAKEKSKLSPFVLLPTIYVCVIFSFSVGINI